MRAVRAFDTDRLRVRKDKARGKATENRKSGNAPPPPRSFDIRPLDHPRDTIPPPYHPLRPRFSPYRAAPASVTTIIERYCITLPKLFHGRDTCAAKDSGTTNRIRESYPILVAWNTRRRANNVYKLRKRGTHSSILR